VALRDFRRRADAVRSIPLETVLTHWGAQRDRRDRRQWRTDRGPLSVTGAKFFNWHLEEGGGGAIDLVMHLGKMEAAAAIAWLQQHLGWASAAASSAAAGGPPSPSSSSRGDAPAPPRALRLPRASGAQLERVRRYLTGPRCLAVGILEPLIDAGKVYADPRGNAVFLMVAGKPNRPIGAELRGTGPRIWHGLAPGTSRDAGYFWVGAKDSQTIVLCESAIDAISCYQLHWRQRHTECICISTAGVRSDPPWLHPLIACGYHIYCGFDDDKPGEAASGQMISRHPSIQRLRPPAHDWNDALTASR
jgi:protein strawberry notch